MTLKQLRRTALYKKLHYDPQNRPASAGKQGARFGNKSYLNKAKLCKYLNNPSKYVEDLNKKYKTSKRAGPRVRKTRAGDCIPKKRVPGPWQFNDQQIKSFSTCFQKVVKGYDSFLGKKCPYIMGLHAAPILDDESFHFHVELIQMFLLVNQLIDS